MKEACPLEDRSEMCIDLRVLDSWEVREEEKSQSRDGMKGCL